MKIGEIRSDIIHFTSNQRSLFQKLEGEIEKTPFEHDSEESRVFWSSVWIKAKAHNKEAEWFME